MTEISVWTWRCKVANSYKIFPRATAGNQVQMPANEFSQIICSSGRYMFHIHAQPGWLRSLSALQSLSHAFDCGESNDCWYDSLSRSSLFTIAFHELDLLQNGLVFNVSLVECAETNWSQLDLLLLDTKGSDLEIEGISQAGLYLLRHRIFLDFPRVWLLFYPQIGERFGVNRLLCVWIDYYLLIIFIVL